MERETLYAEELLDFIDRSPSCFHAVDNIASELVKNGYTRLEEKDRWNLKEGGRYFVTRNDSAIIAFSIPYTVYKGFMITACHSDSPSFKIKENPCIKSEGHYIKLNIEKYGGMLCAPWFDRPLSVAGRVIVRDKPDTKMYTDKIKLKQKLVCVDRNLVMIPSLAIHMNRDANSGYRYNVQDDMLPLLSCDGSTEDFDSIIAESAGVDKEDIVSSDLFLYNRVKGTFWGAHNEFIASSRLDDLECAFTCLKGFLSDEQCLMPPESEYIKVYCVFDNEEVGSETRQGADSTFLYDTLRRINFSMKRSEEDYYTSLAVSFMVSADNAHAVHPNYASCADPVNRPIVNAGPVIKFNAAQKYCTDSISASVFKAVCDKAGVPYQIFTNRSDIAGGSTLGNISGSHVSISSVDIGIAQWAMHSPYESAGTKDVELMINAISEFYNSSWSLDRA